MRDNHWNDPWDRPDSRDTRINQTPGTDDWQREQPREAAAAQPQQPEQGQMPPPYVYPQKQRRSGGCALVVILAVVIAVLLGVLALQVIEIAFDEEVIEQFFYDDGFDYDYDEDAGQDDEDSTTQTTTTEDEATCYLEQAEIGVDVTIEVVSWADMEELTYEEVYARNISAVVSVVCYLSGTSGSTGTGIIIHEDGYIVTNQHVIEGARECYIILEDNTYYEASLVGMDEESDLAVLKIEADQKLTAATFGDSNELVVGNACVAIGDPLGVDFRGTMTTGIISALNRNVEVNGYTMTLIQTDCAINSGNSGGPLINMYGLVVGICNMKMMSSATTVEGLGFAIPSNTIRTVVNKLIAKGEVQKAMLGITAQTLTTAECKNAGIECGILVVTVSETSDACAQGIQAGDIIVAANGVAISTVTELNLLKGDMYPGDTITLTVLRGTEYTEYEVLLMAEDEVY